MHKHLNQFLFVGALSLSILSSNAIAADAQVNYTGEVTQGGCNIEGGNALNLNLGRVKSTELLLDPRGGPEIPFVLTGCPRKINIIFTATSDPDNPTRIKLANAGQSDAAVGVGVAPWVYIRQSDYGSNVKDGWMSMPRFETGEMVNTNNNLRIEMKLSGVMVRTSASKPVRAGKVQATMDISFLYP